MSAKLEVRLQNGELVIVGSSGQELRVREEENFGLLARHILELLEGRASRPLIGDAASPTQRMVDEWLSRGGRVKIIGRKKKLEPTLEELGLA